MTKVEKRNRYRALRLPRCHSHQRISQRLRQTERLRMIYLIIRSLDMLNPKRSRISECLGVCSVLDTWCSISQMDNNLSLYLYRSQVGR